MHANAPTKLKRRKRNKEKKKKVQENVQLHVVHIVACVTVHCQGGSSGVCISGEGKGENRLVSAV